MTPELRLREEELNVSLSCIRKFCFPGMCCIIRSTHIMLEPKMQAKIQLENRSSFLCFQYVTYSAHACHDPSSCIIVEAHVGHAPHG